MTRYEYKSVILTQKCNYSIAYYLEDYGEEGWMVVHIKDIGTGASDSETNYDVLMMRECPEILN